MQATQISGLEAQLASAKQMVVVQQQQQQQMQQMQQQMQQMQQQMQQMQQQQMQQQVAGQQQTIYRQQMPEPVGNTAPLPPASMQQSSDARHAANTVLSAFEKRPQPHHQSIIPCSRCLSPLALCASIVPCTHVCPSYAQATSGHSPALPAHRQNRFFIANCNAEVGEQSQPHSLQFSALKCSRRSSTASSS